MKPLINLVGILLIVFGVVTLAYQGFTYTKQEEVAKVGDVKLTVNTQKTVFISPLVSGVSLAAGLLLVLIGRRS